MAACGRWQKEKVQNAHESRQKLDFTGSANGFVSGGKAF